MATVKAQAVLRNAHPQPLTARAAEFFGRVGWISQRMAYAGPVMRQVHPDTRPRRSALDAAGCLAAIDRPYAGLGLVRFRRLTNIDPSNAGGHGRVPAHSPVAEKTCPRHLVVAVDYLGMTYRGPTFRSRHAFERMLGLAALASTRRAGYRTTMNLLRRLALPLIALVFVIALPLRRRKRRLALRKSGWAELRLTGEVSQTRPERDVAQSFVRRLLKRKDPPRVVLARLRRFVDEIISDSYAKGVLVRVGPLGGGWAAATAIHGELLRLKEAGRHVVVHLEGNVDNRQALIATVGTRITMTPSATLSAAGVASAGLFLRDTLEQLGVRVEATSHGRYKSAPEQFTRVDRSEADLEQTRAIVDQFDDALIARIMAGRVLNRADAEALVDRAPMVGTHAKEAGFCDEIARDEDLLETIRSVDGGEALPTPVGAGRYLSDRTIAPLWPTRRYVGIVKVHGPIIDQPGSLPLPDQQVAAAEAVVDDLRAALSDTKIGAVVLHVDSRGGSVTASDVIYSAVRRLNQEKPVVACFGDVAASGGYYVACGARAIFASPLTLTGSIGVFGLVPTWAKLTERWNVGHDVLKNRQHAAMYDPWSGFDDEARAHAQREVSAMYDTFIDLVAGSRELTKEEVDTVAQGRVWTGVDARQHRLVDDLGGFAAAIEHAKAEAGGRFNADPVVVAAKGPMPRPAPYDPDQPAAPRRWLGVASLDGDPRAGLDGTRWMTPSLLSGAAPLIGEILSGPPLLGELLTLAASARGRRILAYAPVISPV